MLKDLAIVIERLDRMRRQEIWPNGSRYLWTDAFGLVLLVSLYRYLGAESYLREAEDVVKKVEQVLGCPRGVRIGEASDRDGQYFHYLALWAFALSRLGLERPAYRDRAVALVRQIHSSFVHPGVGVIWKMREDLSGPYPGYGYGALDPFLGYVIYRLVAPDALFSEIEQMKELVESSASGLTIDQDLGLGLMLWLTHFFPEEPWAQLHRRRTLSTLQQMWVDPPGYFCRYPGLAAVKFAFTNYGVSLGLQAVGEEEEKIRKLNGFFLHYRSGDRYDTDAITHVMACVSHFPGVFLSPESNPPKADPMR